MFDFTKLRIVDTEGTDSNPKTCELIELAVGYVDVDINDVKLQIKSKLFKPESPIPPEASAINNISNRMVSHAPFAKNSNLEISNLLFGDDAKNFIRTSVFIAHNAAYDYQVIDKYVDLNTSLKTHWICTYRLAKHVLSPHHANIHYNLGYLRYFLDLPVSDELVLHRADGDVTVCWHLFLKLLELAIESNQIDINGDVLQQLIDLSWKPITIRYWPVGKYKNVSLSDIPLDYFTWALDNLDALNEKSSAFDADLAVSVINEVEKRLG